MRNIFRWTQLGTVGLLMVIICCGCPRSARTPETPPAPKPGAPSPTKPPAAAPSAKPRSTPREPAPLPPREAPSPVEAPEKVSHFSHTVRFSGETVSIIAAWYTGDLENWKVLAEANPNLDPNRISPGNKILIPENLLKTRSPMPKEFVDSFYPHSKAKPAPSPPKEKEEEPDLFGPKPFPPK